jgi:hypothetical protein
MVIVSPGRPETKLLDWHRRKTWSAGYTRTIFATLADDTIAFEAWPRNQDNPWSLHEWEACGCDYDILMHEPCNYLGPKGAIYRVTFFERYAHLPSDVISSDSMMPYTAFVVVISLTIP